MTNEGFPIVIDGQTYQLTQLGQGDWKYLLNALKAEFIAEQKAIDPTSVEEIRIQAFKLRQASLFELNWFSTVTGLANLLWRMLLAKYPNITLEQIIKWIEDNLIADWDPVKLTLQAGEATGKGDGGSQAGNSAKTS